jgi:hypothetical protein
MAFGSKLNQAITASDFNPEILNNQIEHETLPLGEVLQPIINEWVMEDER